MNIELYLGSMFSEKSTTLLRKIRQFKAIDLKILNINHGFDTRCDNSIKSHDNIKENAIKCTKLLSIDEKLLKSVNVITIDEAQFFEDLFDFIKKYENLNITLLISGLDGDFQRNKFGQVLDIIPYCNKVTKLNALCTKCKDGTFAHFTNRISQSNDNQVCIGAKDEYEPLCRKHYLQNN